MERRKASANGAGPSGLTMDRLREAVVMGLSRERGYGHGAKCENVLQEGEECMQA